MTLVVLAQAEVRLEDRLMPRIPADEVFGRSEVELAVLLGWLLSIECLSRFEPQVCRLRAKLGWNAVCLEKLGKLHGGLAIVFLLEQPNPQEVAGLPLVLDRARVGGGKDFSQERHRLGKLALL